MEEVINDPSLPDVDKMTKRMIQDHGAKGEYQSDVERFITSSLNGKKEKRTVTTEIEQINSEIKAGGIDELTRDMVTKWQVNKRMDGGENEKSREIRDFIKSSLESGEKIPEDSSLPEASIRTDRFTITKLISLTAAAAVGLFIMFKILLPSSDPDSIYNRYYEPFNIISPVTRGNTGGDVIDISSSIESYKLGNYESAAIGFSDAIFKDPSGVSSHFYLGITYLALGNFKQAVQELSVVAGGKSEYTAEAKWYLGLAFLKTGASEKASLCFKSLYQTSGFYKKRAEKILRRLE